MVMFDLSGTTVHDDTGVRDCLYQAAEYLVARSAGRQLDFRDFEKGQDPATLDTTTRVFHRYEEVMIEGINAGCRGVVAVLAGPRPFSVWGCYRHTHAIPSVQELPSLIETEFC